MNTVMYCLISASVTSMCGHLFEQITFKQNQNHDTSKNNDTEFN